MFDGRHNASLARRGVFQPAFRARLILRRFPIRHAPMPSDACVERQVVALEATNATGSGAPIGSEFASLTAPFPPCRPPACHGEAFEAIRDFPIQSVAPYRR